MHPMNRAAILALLICGWAVGAFSAQITAQLDGEICRLVWQGDERVEVSFSRSRGLLQAPVQVRVDNRSFSFNGFYVAFNEERAGFLIKSASVETNQEVLRVTHLLEHPRLPSPIRVVVRVRMSEADKAVRFEIDTDNGEPLHLGRLGVGNHRGAGIEPKRMFVTKLLVLEPPIEPFKLKYNYNFIFIYLFILNDLHRKCALSVSVPNNSVWKTNLLSVVKVRPASEFLGRTVGKGPRETASQGVDVAVWGRAGGR